jgi:hypothetical protein
MDDLPEGIETSDRFLHPAGSNASRADLDPSGGFVETGLDGFQIRIKRTLGFIVGMADLHADDPAFAADFAYVCHGTSPSHC